MNKKDILELVLANVVIHQSDGFQRGYGQAIADLIDNMVDYTKCSDDELTIDFLNTLVDMGEKLSNCKRVAEDNLNKAKDIGYTESLVYRNQDTFVSRVIHVKDLDMFEDDDEAGTYPLCGADIGGKDYKICAKCSAIVEDGEWRAHYCPDCGEKIKWKEGE